jgi:hypothetical protein
VEHGKAHLIDRALGAGGWEPCVQWLTLSIAGIRGRKRSKESAAFGPVSPPFVSLSIARDTRHVAMDIMEVSGNLNGVI